MSLIKRMSTSITASVGRAVSKVENHDAIINAALRDTQQAAARSRVRLERVRKDGHALRTRHANLQQAVVRLGDAFLGRDLARDAGYDDSGGATDPGEVCLNCDTVGPLLMIPLIGPFLAIPDADGTDELLFTVLD